MSKLGKKPIVIPKDTKIKLESGRLILTGPKGSKEFTLNDKIFSATIADDKNLILKLINKNENLNESALFGCAATTGPGVVFNQAEIKPSDDVVVYGVGGVGIFVIQAAKLMNPKSLISIAINDFGFISFAA
jgi:Zn-dependent alcohol dehydrogenase